VVAATGPKFYAKVEPGPDPKQTRKVNDLGQKARDSRTGKVSRLEVWEGYRAFRDTRSPTGWIDNHRVPIVGIDTHGHALRLNLRTGKPEYVHPTQAGSDGGLLGSISKGLQIFGGDVFGFALDAVGLEDANRVRVQTGIAATGAIVTAGGLGATSLAGLTGASSTIGGASALLGGGGFASLVGSPVPASGIVPIGPAPAAQNASSARGSGGGVLFLVLASTALLLILSRKR